MTRKIVTVAALAGAGLLATACGTASQQGDAGMSGTTPAPAALGAQPRNPVPILKQTGVHVPASVRLGEHDIYGDRYASGSFGRSGDDIRVITTANVAATLARQADGVPDDTHAVITGPGFVIFVYGSPHWSVNSPDPVIRFRPTPQVIARSVHGHLVPG